MSLKIFLQNTVEYVFIIFDMANTAQRFQYSRKRKWLAVHQRWAKSEKLTPKSDSAPKTKTPTPCPSLPCFYIHSICIICHTYRDGSSFSQIIQIRIRKM